MKPITELLTELHARGVRLRAEGGKLAYDAPRGALDADALARLRERKGEILAFLQASSTSADATIPRRGADVRPRLSFGQQRLWFLAQLEGPSGTYNMQTVLRLAGALDASALRRALAEIVARHEVLRTRFEVYDGEPHQVIDPPGAFDLPTVGLEHLDGETQAQGVRAEVRLAAERPIDLGRDRMLRAGLLRLAEDSHVLVLTTHHIASDGWSIGVLLRELSLAYRALVREPDVAPRMPALPIQYADYAVWQRAWLSGARLRQQLDFWKRYLADAPPLLRLPTDLERPRQQTYRGAYASATIPTELVSRLNALSRGADATLFMTMLAAFMALLHRHSGQDDLLLGTHIANRNRQETEPLIGFFVNTLALRADFRGAPSFRELLAQIKGAVETAYEYQDLPYELLVEELRPQRNPAYSPLCQVTFAMQTALGAELQLEGLAVDVMRREVAAARFDLTLGISESRAGLECMWRYNTDLFAAGTIEAMASQLGLLLRGICDAPDAPLVRLPLSDAVGAALLPGAAAAAEAPLVHDLFTAQVLRSPDAPALVVDAPSEAITLSYRQLGSRVAQLAAVLRELGVGPEVRVGVCLERSAAAVVAAFAVWAAGGVYVPVDPEHPETRRLHLLTDAGARLLLVQRSLAPPPTRFAGRVVIIDELERVPAPASVAPCAPCPAGLAYVMYTSGSSGQPKGVMVSHRNLGRYTQGLAEAVGFGFGIGVGVGVGVGEVYLHTASFGFSSSIRQMVVPLTCGATLVVASAEQRRDPLALFGLIRGHRVSVVDLVPSHWRSLLEARLRGAVDEPLPLRLVLSASEPLTADLLHAWRTDAGLDTAVCNMYGQTETTGIVTTQPLVIGAPPAGGSCVRVGRPIAGASVYVLDRWLEPCPIGVPGELYVGGDTVARGYVGGGALTAERFLPDPFAAAPGSRMYRTGDLARCAADGTIEYLQRGDLQVKVRGHRVEPAEIEAVLAQHAEVAEVVVAVGIGATGEPQLVAYAVARADVGHGDDRVRDWPELLEHARCKLPTYMVPATVLRMARLPRTASGKLERAGLPAADLSRSRGFVPPRDSLEQRVAAIWCEVLGLTLIGVKDSFFALGGHSLLAVRLLARIHRELGRRLPLTALFDNQTVEALADVLRDAPADAAQDELRAGREDDCLVALQPRGARPPLFFVPGGGGSALYLYHLARQLGQDQPLYGLQPRGLDGVAPPHASVEATAAYFIARVREVQPRGPYRLGGHSFGGKVVLEMAQQLLRAGERVALLAVVDTGPWRDEDMSTGDLVRDMLNYLDAMAEFTGGRCAARYEDLAALDDDGRLLVMKSELERLRFLPPRVELHEVRGLLNVLIGSTRAANAYAPSGLLPVAVSLFSAGSHSVAEHERQVRRWSAVGPVELFVVPGTHASMMAEPNVASLADHLSALLARTHQAPEEP